MGMGIGHRLRQLWRRFAVRGAEAAKAAPRGAGAARTSARGWVPLLASDWTSGPAAWADDPREQVRHYHQWVYAAVRAIADRVAATELRVFYRRGNDLQLLDDPAHPLLRLLEEVNPIQTRYGLWAETMAFLELTGNAYWYIAANGLGTPAEIWVIPSQHMRVVPDPQTFIRGYLCRHAGREVFFARREVIHLKYPNPCSPYYGRGPLQAAAAAVDNHEQLKRAECMAFRHGVLSDLALETDHYLPPGVIERLRTQVHQKFAGPENAGRPLVLEGGLRAKPISLSPREMAFVQSARLLRDEIFAIFGVPAAVTGLSEDVNRAVAEAMDVIFARYCIEPKLRLIEAQLNQDLLPRFDPGLVCRFAPVVPGDQAQQRADMEANLRLGVTTINEERRRQGRPPVAWGERPLLPANYAPIGISPPHPTRRTRRQVVEVCGESAAV